CHIDVGRKRDHPHIARSCELPDRRYRMCEDRSENDLATLVERLLRSLLGAGRAAAVVLEQKLQIRNVELGERHFGGVAHRGTGGAGVTGGGQRQDEPDLDLTLADTAGGSRGRGRRRTAKDVARRVPAAGGQQGGCDKYRRPSSGPPRSRSPRPRRSQHWTGLPGTPGHRPYSTMAIGHLVGNA